MSIGRPARQLSVIAEAASAWIPTTRHVGRVARSQRADPVDERSVPDGHGHDRGRRQIASLDRVGQLDRQRGGAGRDPRIVAVDEELRVVLGRVGLRGAAGLIEVLPDLTSPSRRAPASVRPCPRLALRDE